MDLFQDLESKQLGELAPLAARLRPAKLDEFVGQEHLLGPNQLLGRLIRSGNVPSCILAGPSGTGKTTLAKLLSTLIAAEFVELNALDSGVKELREQVEQARSRLAVAGKRTILFVDEVHRFSRSQQDALLPGVEHGFVILIATTTANPYFAISSALISRCQVFIFEPIAPADVIRALDRIIQQANSPLAKRGIKLTEEAKRTIAELCDGDLRRAINWLELASASLPVGITQIDETLVREVIQRKGISYDRDGNEHYDSISAFIKSMRASDPDAAVYWLVRMLESGEDPRFIARRMVIFASEDVGLADRLALPNAIAAAQAVEMIGMPACDYNLGHVAIYLAKCAKSASSYAAVNAAREHLRQHRTQPVPRKLRDAHYKAAKQLGHGVGYDRSASSHDSSEYMGIEATFYVPTEAGDEATLSERSTTLPKPRDASDASHMQE